MDIFFVIAVGRYDRSNSIIFYNPITSSYYRPPDLRLDKSRLPIINFPNSLRLKQDWPHLLDLPSRYLRAHSMWLCASSRHHQEHSNSSITNPKMFYVTIPQQNFNSHPCMLFSWNPGLLSKTPMTNLSSLARMMLHLPNQQTMRPL